MRCLRIALAFMFALLASCGANNDSSQQQRATAGQSSANTITGAGSTFAYPVFSKWAQAFQQASNISMNYQSIGSGGGIKQIEAGTVDFGASDKPLKMEELNKYHLAQFPGIMGGVVPVINLPGIKPGQLKLSGPVLADIFMGKVSKWNDPEITQLNPGIALPDKAITVVHRSDGSGTTFIFTNYLSKVSPDWKSRVGAETAVHWPLGIGGKGNEGVGAFVERIKGSIGYLEYAFVKQVQMTHVQLQARDGNFIQPNLETFQAAAANAHWDPASGFFEILTNEPGAQSWPITGATFVLMHQIQERPVAGKHVLAFFDWSFKNGLNEAKQLDYVPLPPNVVALIEKSWAQIKDNNGNAVWTGGATGK